MRRNPIRSETDAFGVTVATVALAALSLLLGWLLAPLVGVIVFVVVGLLALGAYLRTPEPDRRMPLREAASEHDRRHAAGRDGRGRHVLVVANEPLEGEELRERIVGRNGASVELDVLAPVLTSRTHLAVTDIDAELDRARERLERSLAWARSHGLNARGEIGDPDPATAIEDELRAFGADEVIVVTCEEEPGDRQEQAELERLCDELDVPVVHVAIGG